MMRLYVSITLIMLIFDYNYCVGLEKKSNIQATLKLIDLTTIEGDTFHFSELSDVLKPYGFSSWHINPSFSSKTLDASFAGNKAKLTNDIYNDFIIAILEDGRKVYSHIGNANTRDEIKTKLKLYTNIYFDEDIDAADNLIGKTVWANTTFYKKGILSTNNRTMIPIGNIEPLKVLEIDTERKGYGYGACPFVLLVQRMSGEKGFLSFSTKTFYTSNPIDHRWPHHIVDLIKGNKIVIGMTNHQVILAWGIPNDINRSVGSWGLHEQWVYGQEQYLYFENGILKSWQD